MSQMPTHLPANMQDTILALLRLGARREEAELFAHLAFTFPPEFQRCTLQELLDMFDYGLSGELNYSAEAHPLATEPAAVPADDTLSSSDTAVPTSAPPFTSLDEAFDRLFELERPLSPSHAIWQPGPGRRARSPLMRPQPETLDPEYAGMDTSLPAYDSPGLSPPPIGEGQINGDLSAAVNTEDDGGQTQTRERTSSFECAHEADTTFNRGHHDSPASTPPCMTVSGSTEVATEDDDVDDSQRTEPSNPGAASHDPSAASSDPSAASRELSAVLHDPGAASREAETDQIVQDDPPQMRPESALGTLPPSSNDTDVMQDEETAVVPASGNENPPVLNFNHNAYSTPSESLAFSIDLGLCLALGFDLGLSEESEELTPEFASALMEIPGLSGLLLSPSSRQQDTSQQVLELGIADPEEHSPPGHSSPGQSPPRHSSPAHSLPEYSLSEYSLPEYSSPEASRAVPGEALQQEVLSTRERASAEATLGSELALNTQADAESSEAGDISVASSAYATANESFGDAEKYAASRAGSVGHDIGSDDASSHSSRDATSPEPLTDTGGGFETELFRTLSPLTSDAEAQVYPTPESFIERDPVTRQEGLPPLDSPFSAPQDSAEPTTEPFLRALRLGDRTEPLRQVDAEPIHPQININSSSNILSVFSESMLSQGPSTQQRSSARLGSPILQRTASDSEDEANTRDAAAPHPWTIDTSQPVFVIPSYPGSSMSGQQPMASTAFTSESIQPQAQFQSHQPFQPQQYHSYYHHQQQQQQWPVVASLGGVPQSGDAGFLHQPIAQDQVLPPSENDFGYVTTTTVRFTATQPGQVQPVALGGASGAQTIYTQPGYMHVTVVQQPFGRPFNILQPQMCGTSPGAGATTHANHPGTQLMGMWQPPAAPALDVPSSHHWSPVSITNPPVAASAPAGAKVYGKVQTSRPDTAFLNDFVKRLHQKLLYVHGDVQRRRSDLVDQCVWSADELKEEEERLQRLEARILARTRRQRVREQADARRRHRSRWPAQAQRQRTQVHPRRQRPAPVREEREITAEEASRLLANAGDDGESRAFRLMEAEASNGYIENPREARALWNECFEDFEDAAEAMVGSEEQPEQEPERQQSEQQQLAQQTEQEPEDPREVMARIADEQEDRDEDSYKHRRIRDSLLRAERRRLREQQQGEPEIEYEEEDDDIEIDDEDEDFEEAEDDDDAPVLRVYWQDGRYSFTIGPPNLHEDEEDIAAWEAETREAEVRAAEARAAEARAVESHATEYQAAESQVAESQNSGENMQY